MKTTDAARTPSTTQAFSLVELSVVLVIIGLLVGGIAGGKSLIHSAGLRSTIAQITEITTGVTTFKSQYGGYPGDIVNAQNYWPTALNGNGNGLVETTAGCQMGDVNYEPDCGKWDGERAQAFMQLTLAGLVTATYSYDMPGVIGKDYPAIKMYSGQGMMITGPWYSASASNMNAQLYTPDTIYLYMGICNAGLFPNTTGAHNDCAIFTAEEASNIDTKLDDGNAITGKDIGTSTTTTCTDASGNYNVINGDPTCEPMISLVP